MCSMSQIFGLESVECTADVRRKATWYSSAVHVTHWYVEKRPREADSGVLRLFMCFFGSGK